MGLLDAVWNLFNLKQQQQIDKKEKEKPVTGAGTMHKEEKNETKTMNKKIKRSICDNQSRWADLPEDLLNIIINNMNMVDYFSFRRVCRSWRLFSSEYEHSFMASRSPLVGHIKDWDDEACYFQEIATGIKYKIELLRYPYDWICCLSVSNGYLIMKASRGILFCVINPFTKHQFIFSCLHKISFISEYHKDRAILASVGSQDQDFVLVVLSNKDKDLDLYTSSDNQWKIYSYLGKHRPILDLIVFYGRIYVVTADSQIGILNVRSLVVNFLNPKSAPLLNSCARFVASNKQLSMVNYLNEWLVKVYRIDFLRMEWVEVNDLGEQALCIGKSSFGMLRPNFINPTKWGGQSNCVYVLLFNGCFKYSFNSSKLEIIHRWGSDFDSGIYWWYFVDNSNTIDKLRDD